MSNTNNIKIILSVILPTYNERDNIVLLIQKIAEVLNNISYEIVVVDDNSPDGTAEAVRVISIQNQKVKVYVRKNERGLASAILYGINNSSGENILVMDTDFNHDPGVIPFMLEKSKLFNMVIGSRFVNGGGMEDRQRYFYSLIYNKLLQLILLSKVKDNLCGYFLIPRNLLKNLNLSRIFYGYGDYFIRLVYYVQKYGYTFIEIPVFYKLRQYGQSKSKFAQMLNQYTVTALQLRFKRGLSPEAI